MDDAAVAKAKPDMAIVGSASEVSLRRISSQSVADVCELSETLTEAQRNKVEGFYKRLGFAATGETYDDEVEAVLNSATEGCSS